MEDILDHDETTVLKPKLDDRIKLVGILRGIICLKLIGLLGIFTRELIPLFSHSEFTSSDIENLFIIIPLLLILFLNVPQAYKEIKLNPACTDKRLSSIFSILSFVILSIFSILSIIGGFVFLGIASLFLIFFIIAYIILAVTDIMYLKGYKNEK